VREVSKQVGRFGKVDAAFQLLFSLLVVPSIELTGLTILEDPIEVVRQAEVSAC
jgi:hypothetical protein